MAKARVDYSELVEALQNGDNAKATELVTEVVSRLEDYLIVLMGADRNDAGECVQQAFVDVFDQVRKGKIKNPKYFYRYLIKACRNEYIMYIEKQHRFKYEEDVLAARFVPEQQFQRLLDKDRQKILKKCLKELQQKSRVFIEYFIDKPDTTAQEASEKFDLSSSSVRTRKHRILGKLHHCFKRKSNE